MRTTPPTAIDWLDNSPLLGLYTEPSYCWLAAPGAIYGSSEGACDAIGSGVVRFPPHSSFYNETCTHIRSGFFFFLSLLFSVMERVPPFFLGANTFCFLSREFVGRLESKGIEESCD